MPKVNLNYKFDKVTGRNKLKEESTLELSCVNHLNLKKGYDMTHKIDREIPPFKLEAGRKRGSIFDALDQESQSELS